MTRQTGVWIDHRQAIVVSLLDDGEEIKTIESNIEKHVRYSGASHPQTPDAHADAAEDKRDRRYDDHLNQFYDAVIETMHSADSILIIGPGEAKHELQKRLEVHPHKGQVVGVESSDKLTDGQIVAQVRRFYVT